VGEGGSKPSTWRASFGWPHPLQRFCDVLGDESEKPERGELACQDTRAGWRNEPSCRALLHDFASTVQINRRTPKEHRSETQSANSALPRMPFAGLTAEIGSAA